MCYNFIYLFFSISGRKDTHYFRITNELHLFFCIICAKNGAKLHNSSRLFLFYNMWIQTIYYYLTRSPAGLKPTGLVLCLFSLFTKVLTYIIQQIIFQVSANISRWLSSQNNERWFSKNHSLIQPHFPHFSESNVNWPFLHLKRPFYTSATTL